MKVTTLVMSREASHGQLGTESCVDEHYPNCACCLIDRKYIIPKMFYLFYFAGLGAVLPYQPLFYKDLGIPAKKAGIISGIQPFVSFLFTPVWGAVADKFQKGRFIFVMSFTALTAVGIAYILTPMPHCEDAYGRRSLCAIQSKGNYSILYKFSQQIIESHDLNRWPIQAEESESNLQTRESKQHEVDEGIDVFLYLLLVSLFGTLFSCPSLPLGDAAVVCKLRKNNDVHKYGKQKRWASIGWGVAAFSFGAIISDRYLCPDIPQQKAVIDYSLCFYGSIVLKLLALFSGFRLDFNMNGDNKGDQSPGIKEETRGAMEVLKAIREPRFLAFLVVVLYSGMTFGMIMGFFFWHLKDNSAPHILFSIIPVIRSVADVIVYTISPHIITLIGVRNLIYLVLVGYITRLTCFTFVSSAWAFIPLELLSGLTSAGGWAAFVAFIAYHSVEGAPATLQGILHAAYHGIGHGLGRVIGGFLFSSLGSKATFSIFGGFGIIMLIMYFTVNKAFENT
ncbi:major facilitator superfamily domain-containing protein 6-like [Montipora foliosa]|uniref:major facilitator superfamily domain-containing protein 6-like n=1 Tax=Montipora foliosa TaxID=591990 RepID=UPI0035F1A832